MINNKNLNRKNRGLSRNVKSYLLPIIDFIKNYSLPTAEVNKSLTFYIDEAGGDMEGTAKNYLKSSSSWTKWVPSDVAKKVKIAL